VQRHVPPGWTAVTDKAEATRRGHTVFAGLPARRRDQYRRLWDAALDDGWQRSGLLLVCLSALSPVLGYTTPTVPKQFGQYCRAAGLWCRVPGRLYPVTRHVAPGERARCYLVITPGR
jgi:hypothetical protein